LQALNPGLSADARPVSLGRRGRGRALCYPRSGWTRPTPSARRRPRP